MNNIVTNENVYKILEKREVKDILSSYKHPNHFRDENGFTYFDLILWRLKRDGSLPKHVLNEINKILDKEKYYE